MSSVYHPRRGRAFYRLAALALSFVASSPLTALAQETPAASGASSSTPDPVVACLADHTEGQKLRRDGKLIESRDAFRQCSASACPSQIIRDCWGWTEEVDRQIPSVSFAVTADGVNRADAQVFIDDEPLQEKLSGRAIDINPGPHRVRVSLPPFEPFEEEVVIVEGDKFRVVEVKFVSPHAKPDPLAPMQGTAQPEIEKNRPVPMATYVLGGVGAAAALNGAAWGIANLVLRSKMEDRCAPDCSDKSIGVLKQRALVADISWGVSIVSLASAATLYFLRPEEEAMEPPIALDVQMLPAGALGTISISNF